MHADDAWLVLSYAGSTTVYPYDNPSLTPVELGASIFVDANLNMQRSFSCLHPLSMSFIGLKLTFRSPFFH
jgi:cytochrome c peroxidase